jgi:hypothetical protein
VRGGTVNLGEAFLDEVCRLPTHDVIVFVWLYKTWHFPSKKSALFSATTTHKPQNTTNYKPANIKKQIHIEPG